MNEAGKRRGAAAVMGRLIGLVKSLLPVMFLSVALGVAGYLCAIFLTISAAGRLVMILFPRVISDGNTGIFGGLSNGAFFAVLALIAVMRGVLHYGEQYCNHYIAFRLLAIIRHKVFAKLRQLCPAKLEGHDKGDLISVLTSDIELLEVFYAHTISPIAIAAIVCVMMTVFIGSQAPAAAVIAAAGYICVGIIIPVFTGSRGAQPGLDFRNAFGALNSTVLDELRGIDETVQYGLGEKKSEMLDRKSCELSGLQKKLADLEAFQRSVTNFAILAFSVLMLLFMALRFQSGAADIMQLVTAVTAMMGSFGPAVALANLSNNLNQTLASGERVLDILEERPQVEEVTEGAVPETFDGLNAEKVSFRYGDEQVLRDLSIAVEEGKLTGIHGTSGSGKSTLLKLMMRFWDPDSGRISISGEDLREIQTGSLRDMESYMTQETVLFHTSIGENISIARPEAGNDEIEAAARKASIHEFISSLPQGYDTPVGELGDTLSGGERQRIGLARAFLHDAPLLLLDEPTSNLDTLNEGMILKSLSEEMRDKQRTIVLVSHRLSTLGIADQIIQMPERKA